MTPTPTDTMEGRPTGREGELHKVPPARPGFHPRCAGIATRRFYQKLSGQHRHARGTIENKLRWRRFMRRYSTPI